MSFPQTPLAVFAELNINGTWVAADVRSANNGYDAITITRGIGSSGGAVADRGTCALTLDNNSGDYSSRNPLSPYYPHLGLNTPIRVGAAYGTPWLDCPYGSTNTASTPDASVLDIVGDLDVRVDAELAVWGDGIDSTGGTTELCGKYNITGNQRSWRLLVNASQAVELGWSVDGTTVMSAQSAPLSLPPGSRVSVRATLDVNNGSGGWTATFYTSTTAGTAGPWTQLGSTVTGTGTTSIFNSTSPLYVGDIPSIGFGNLPRKVYKAEVRSGLAGTIVANPNFEAQTVGATSFADTAPSPRTWTVTAGGVSNRYVRFSGEVSEWPPQWDTGGFDVTTPIQASGILQRYGQSKTNIQSALRRSIIAAKPLVYWPMEDGAASTQAASGLIGGTPLVVVSGAPVWAATEGPPGSLPLPDFSGTGTLTAPVPLVSTTSWTIDMILNFADTVPAGGLSVVAAWMANGSRAQYWELDAQRIVDGGLSIQWADIAFDDFGGPYYSNVGVLQTGWRHVRITVAQSGTAISIQCWLDGTRIINATEATVTLGALRNVTINPVGGETDDTTPSVGHLAVWEPSTTLPTYLAMNGNDGESAATRIARISTEQGVAMSIAALAGDTELVGPQTVDTTLNVLSAATLADEGLLHEARENLGLRYRGRATLYNQPSALDVPYTTTSPQPLVAPLTPVGDLQGRLNDSTVTRANGSSGRFQVTEGRLSVQEPPNGIGTGYDENITLSLHSDYQTTHHAGWRTHVGTFDADRFPQVNIELAKDPTLIPAATRLDTGSRMRITPPLLPQLPPDPIDQMVLGYTEVLAQYSWRLSLACQPYGPWLVGVLDDSVFGRADTDGSSLAAGVTATATSLSVAVTAGPLWVTTANNPSEFPFDIRVGGEVITVGGISGTSSPQTFSPVTRSVNGVSKPQALGADVRLAQPMILAL